MYTQTKHNSISPLENGLPETVKETLRKTCASGWVWWRLFDTKDNIYFSQKSTKIYY